MNDIYVARSPKIAARMLDGEMMIMSARDATLFNLNETASAIWREADGSTTLREIVERAVCPQFEVAPEEALKDAEEFVRELAAHGILVVSDQPVLKDAK
jgi:hypothetical protein